MCSVCVEVTETTPPIHSSAQMVREHFATPLEASLDDCLQWHTREEKVHLLTHTHTHTHMDTHTMHAAALCSSHIALSALVHLAGWHGGPVGVPPLLPISAQCNKEDKLLVSAWHSGHPPEEVWTGEAFGVLGGHWNITSISYTGCTRCLYERQRLGYLLGLKIPLSIFCVWATM